MKMELGCWVENQPVDVVDKDILVGTVIDPNGMTLQFIQFSNKRFYVEEDVGNDKNTHLITLPAFAKKLLLILIPSFLFSVKI